MRVAVDGRDVVVRESVSTVQQAHLRRAHANQPVGSPHPDVLLTILKDGRDTVVRQVGRYLNSGVLPARNEKQSFAQSADPHSSRVIFLDRADDARRMGPTETSISSDDAKPVVGAQPERPVFCFANLIHLFQLIIFLVRSKFPVLHAEQARWSAGKHSAITPLIHAKKSDVGKLKFPVDALKPRTVLQE